jgi:GTP-binding protein
MQELNEIPALLPIITIVGRPNVGKSTLFNRLSKKRLAIVADEPGTTRDRLMAHIEWQGRNLGIVDTGGLESLPDTELLRRTQEQVRVAIKEADLILFLVDAHVGLTPADQEVTDILRLTDKPVLLVANKADNPQRELEALEFYQLGLGDPMIISAYHNLGIDVLLSKVLECLDLPEVSNNQEKVSDMKLAIVGRPNVGKSMLLNAILGEERAVVSDVPGTTRDAIDTYIEYRGRPVTLIDTAGVRRRGRVSVGIEKFSVLRAMRAIERADVVLLIVDSQEFWASQDQHLAGYLADAYKGIVVVVNKWDIAEEAETDQARFRRKLRTRLKFLPYAPVRFTSALRSEGIEEVLDIACDVYDQRHREVDVDALRNVVLDAVMEHQPPTAKGKYIHIRRPKQDGVNPPTFSFEVNHPDLVHFSYRRYLENRLRAAFGFRGSPLKLIFKKRSGGWG